MYTWSEILAVAAEMGLDLVWGRIGLMQIKRDSLFLCKGQSVALMTLNGKYLQSFRVVVSGGPDYAWLEADKSTPFTWRLMLNRLG